MVANWDTRSAVLEQSLRKLGVERLSKDDVQKMQWEVLEAKIGNWIHYMRISVRMNMNLLWFCFDFISVPRITLNLFDQVKLLIVGEKKICDQIFEGVDSVKTQCFAEVTGSSVAMVLSFGEAIARSKRSPEKLFVLLDMYEIMRELQPEIESLFDSKVRTEMREAAISLTKRLAQTAQETFGDFEEAVEKDATKTAVQDGTVHPLTSYVINYVKFLYDYQATLKQLFQEFDPGDPESQLASVTTRIMQALQNNLDGKSKLYKDPGLTQLFLMNNIHYIVRSVRRSEAKDMLGDDWVQIHRRIVQQHANQYKRISWAKGSDAIQGIMFDPPKHIGEVDSKGLSRKIKVDWNRIAFEKMHHLRILIVRGPTFSSKPKHLPNHLRLLNWTEYPSKTLPPEFYPRNIINLNLRNSQLTIKKPFEQFLYLTVMDFSNNQSMKTMPDVSKIENLRELQLAGCDNLTTVHESIGFLKHLVRLRVSNCRKLKNFLQKMFLPSLEVLALDFCFELEHFPDIVGKMHKPLKIYMRSTSIKKLPNSVGNLIGLVSIDMQYSDNLEYLPSSLFRLPNVVAFKFGRCSKLGESFRRFVPNSPSEANEHSTLKTVSFSCSDLLEEDIHTILVCFPKLEELVVSFSDNLVSLPACIKEFNHLTELDVRYCKKLKEIPEFTNLRFLDVCGCSSLVHISELPHTIQTIDASECFNLSWETRNMLWDQVKKERHGLEIVMPRTKVPEWFDCSRKGGIPCLWIRRKFPINVYVAFMFQKMDGEKDRFDKYVFQLYLVINGQSVRQKKFKPSQIQTNHVLVCDLRHVYNDDEWLSIDALLLKHEWNQVQISYENVWTSRTLTLSEWGVYVYKQGTVNWEEHVQFMCPDPTRYSNIIEELALDETDKPRDKVTMFQTMKKWLVVCIYRCYVSFSPC